MATVDINGKLVDFPDSLSPGDLQKAVAAAASQLAPKTKTMPSSDNRGMIRKGWDALAVPEQMSRTGLQTMANAVPRAQPTGNRIRDVALNTPGVLADTVAQVAPSFVSRGAILTAGAAKIMGAASPLVRTIGRGLGRQLESASGAVEGSLPAAYNDAGLMLEKGKDAAGKLYEAAKAEIPKGASLFEGMYKPEEIVDATKKILSSGGKLEPAEAFTARKAVDSLLKNKRYVKDALFELRQTLDAIAKESANIAEADPVFKRGLYANSLRNLLPQNKYGGASPFKTMILKLTGGAAAPLLSPAIQGVGATAAGVMGRNVVSPLASSPATASAIAPLLRALRASKKKS